MSTRLTASRIGDQVSFRYVPDPKFKHNLISVSFITPLDTVTASDNAAVPHILRKGSRACPDFSALNARLSELYGAQMDATVGKFGGHQILGLSIRSIDNRYALGGDDVAGDCARLLADVILNPKTDADGCFDEKDVETERQLVIDTIEAEINDKRTYALSRCIQTMCAGEPVAVRRYGEIETARNITPRSAADAYRRLLETSAVEIMFIGPGDPKPVQAIFEKAFSALPRKAAPVAPVVLREEAQSVRECTETMDITQAKLVMGLRTGSFQNPETLYAMRLACAMLGGTPFSKLFLNVRERLSLCYYCAARFDTSNKLLLIDSGIESGNRQKVVDEVFRQIQALQDGDFTDEEITNTKLLMNTSILSTGDSPSRVENWYMSQIMQGKNDTPDEDMAKIGAVTREQIVAAARQITPDTIYFLTGTETEAGA